MVKVSLHPWAGERKMRKEEGDNEVVEGTGEEDEEVADGEDEEEIKRRMEKFNIASLMTNY